jgi:hypothetical protein
MNQLKPKAWNIFTIKFNVRLMTLVALFFIVTSPAHGQWTTSGSNITYTSGNVGIGTSTPETSLHVATESTATPRGVIVQQSNSGNNSAFLILRKSRGTIASPAAIVNGDSLGAIYAEAHTGSAYLRTGANIKFVSNGTVEASSVPTDIAFSAGSSGTGTEFMRITSAGNVGIGTSAPASLLTVNANTSGLQVPGTNFAGTLLHVSGADNAKARLLFDAFGAGFQPQLTYRFARGTAASPAAVQSGDTLGQVTASGYKATGYAQGSRAVITFLSTENWTDTANGTAIIFGTTANGSAAVVERLRIDHNGNIGIGTTNPVFDSNTTRYFSVDGGSGSFASIGAAGGTGSNGTAVGQLAFINSNLGTTEKRVATIVGATDTATNSGLLDFYTANGGTWVSRLRINSAGNIGVGTTSPGFRFDVQGGQLNVSGGLCIAGDCKTAWSQVGGSQWSNASSNIYFNTGNVGIGTTTPASRFDVGAGAVRGSYTDLVVGAGGNNAQIELYGPNKSAALTNDETLNGMVLYTNGPSFNPTLFLGNSGNVGIGTTSPSDLMQIDTASGWGLRVKYTGDGQYLRLSANQVSSFTSAGVGRDLYLNPGGGNVGVGTATPNSTYKLDVNGNANFTGNLNATGTITGGNIQAKYQDVAEWVESSQRLSAGTVVILDPTKSNNVIASAQAYDTRVAGVISLQPGITLGEKSDTKVLVATTGRVKVKVDATSAPIHVGDLLVTSDVAGVAKKSEPLMLSGVQIHRPGTLIGKALEPLETGTGEILVLLSLQ